MDVKRFMTTEVLQKFFMRKKSRQKFVMASDCLHLSPPSRKRALFLYYLLLV